MDQSRVSNVRTAAVLLATILVITGCSSTRLAYRYADWGIVWWVEDFITLTKPQKRQLNADIEELKQWHCSTELPRYQAWLHNLQSELAEGKPGPAEISSHQNQLLSLLQPLMHQITPGAVNLLSSLSDEQVCELAKNMAENQRELEEEFLTGDAKSIEHARAERTEERAERWLGSLNPVQKDIIKVWSEDRAGQTEIWLAGRRNWQDTLLNALEYRSQADFEATITELINNPKAGRGDAYAQRIDESMVAMNSLIQELLLASHASQLDHLTRRISELGGDFEALTCKPSPEVASLNR